MQEKQSKEAIRYAKTHKKEIAETVLQNYTPVETPLSIFMAGSPGAGKTEWAQGFAQVLEGDILHLDGDALRSFFPGYQGHNSHLFQKAMSKLVSYIHDQVLAQNISFILDGTFSDLQRAEENIRRSLKRNRKVIIVYIYLSPEDAWQYTQDREMIEGRRITKDTFIQKYYGAYQTVRSVREIFDNKDVEILFSNRTNMVSDTTKILSITDTAQLDEMIPRVYNKEELEQLL